MHREYFGAEGIIFIPSPAIPAQEAIPAQTPEEFVRECFEWGAFRERFPEVETMEDVLALVNEDGVIVYGDNPPPKAQPPKPKIYLPGDA